MASCGEVDHSTDSALASGKKAGGGDSVTGGSGSGSQSPSPVLPVPECAICLQSCVHPVRLPCRHVFCFLCVKGASWHSKRCALCRQEVPEDFLERPTLLSPEELKASATGGRGTGAGDHAWYYEGRNGWWQYDERTSRELEDALVKGKKQAEMLIAGFLYVADLENMVQYRRNEHGRRRRMKRDVVDIPKKGVAGLRLDPEAAPERESSADGADTGLAAAAGGGGGRGAAAAFAPPPVRPPTVLGGHPTSPASPSPPSLDHALAQLRLSPGEEEEDEGEEEEEEDETAAPDASGYDSESGSSEEEERGGGGGEEEEEEEGVAQSRHRLLRPERPPPGGGSAPGGRQPRLRRVRSRSPDGQCTVTEV